MTVIMDDSEVIICVVILAIIFGLIIAGLLYERLTK